MPVQSALAKRFAVIGAIVCIVALATSAWFHVTTYRARPGGGMSVVRVS